MNEESKCRICGKKNVYSYSNLPCSLACQKREMINHDILKNKCEIENPDIVLTASCHDREALEDFFKQVKEIMQQFDKGLEVHVITKDGVINENNTR